MKQQHPVTPPQWQMDGWQAQIETMGADVPSILLEVIQWGREQANADIERKLQQARDQELEACLGWLVLNGYGELYHKIRAARGRRESLKEQALQALNDAIKMADNVPPEGICSDQADIIRRALEALPDISVATWT